MDAMWWVRRLGAQRQVLVTRRSHTQSESYFPVRKSASSQERASAIGLLPASRPIAQCGPHQGLSAGPATSQSRSQVSLSRGWDLQCDSDLAACSPLRESQLLGERLEPRAAPHGLQVATGRPPLLTSPPLWPRFCSERGEHHGSQRGELPPQVQG